MSFAIVTDSTCDLTAEDIQEMNVSMVPLNVEVDGKVYVDQVEISCEQFYDLMKASENMPKSSAPAPARFLETYNELKAAGADGIMTIHIARTLSGTIGSAEVAAQDFDLPVVNLDSRGATGMEALAVRYAAKLRDEGVALEEAAAKIDELMLNTEFYAAADNYDALLAGGRMQPEQANAAAALNIKPVISFEPDGKVKSVDPGRGWKGVAKGMAGYAAAAQEKYGKLAIRFFHSRNMAAVDYMKAELEAAGVDYVDAGTCPCGAIITTHLGVGAAGMSFAPEN